MPFLRNLVAADAGLPRHLLPPGARPLHHLVWPALVCCILRPRPAPTRRMIRSRAGSDGSLRPAGCVHPPFMVR